MKKIAIVGGTHGNELTGIRLIEKWMKNTTLVARNNLDVELLYGNPLAIRNQVRFIDEDLNRAFHVDDLNNPPGESWESQQAHRLNKMLGPKFNNPSVDVIIDLHTTTSNMGNTIIIYNEPFNMKLAKYIQCHEDNVRIYISDKKAEDTVGLQSVAPHGATIEIGPIPQGVLFHEQFETMERTTYHALDFIQAYDNAPGFDITGEIEAYQRGVLIPYPTDESGKICAMLHKDIQNKDYCLLKKGDPMFITFSGKVMHYEGDAGFPVFINEAAYYEKNMALRMNKKIMLTIPPRDRL
ncbi:MAG: aspartoacylase [Phycisphaerae bacterium]|nr:aspartoacylase [Phycisphaerae bacterium]